MFAVGRATATVVAATTSRRFLLVSSATATQAAAARTSSRYVNEAAAAARSFSNGAGGGDDTKNGDNNNKRSSVVTVATDGTGKQKHRTTGTGSSRPTTTDPFGLDYEDGPDGLGPEDKFPPRYVRDLSTGSMTGEMVKELTTRDKELLEMNKHGANMNDGQRLAELEKQVQDTLSQKESQDKLAKHVLSDEVIKSKEVRAHHPQRHQWEALQKKYLRALEQKEKVTERDFQKSHNRTMTDEEKKYHSLLDTHELHDSALDQKDETTSNNNVVRIPDEWAHPDQNPSNPWAAENLAWVAQDVNEGVQESGAGTGEHLEFMPPELIQGPNTKLNRRQATLLPTHLRHHNNLALLRKYMTPGGQIMPRSQTRLGAKDQRKVATLIKRARSMGLIPTIGQWKVHDHGNLLLTDAELDNSKTEWETVFEKAGLIGPDAKQYKTKMEPSQWTELLRRGKEAGLVEADDSIPLKDEMYKLQAKMNNIKLVNHKK
jgi:ribosomal protein S18